MAKRTFIQNLFGETVSIPSSGKRKWIGTANCKHCGKTFKVPHPGGYQSRKGKVQEFCSNRCRWDFQPKPKKQKTKTQRFCACGKLVTLKRARYCSFECRPSNKPAPPRPPTKHTCIICQREFYGTAKTKYCSAKCIKKAARLRYGTKHRHRARRFKVEYQCVNRTLVFERDGWRCQICGCSTPKRLRGTLAINAPELDHRIPMAMGGSHTYDNVQCACRRCNGRKAGTQIKGQIPLWHKPTRKNAI